ncbi:MAG: BTAD domain-containing putative transcriptional regulator [Arenibacterium sp.]
MDAQKKLKLRLIGAFSVTDDQNASVSLSGRKDRAVLAFLGAHPDRPIARERLVDLIWPGAADGAGRASLRQSISTIRKALSNPDILSVDRDTITLNGACVETDVQRLETAPPDASPLGPIPLASGETFLDDLSGFSNEYDTWRATEQSRLEARVSAYVEDIATRAEQASDMKKAAAALSQLVALNPLNEVAQRRYMLALLAIGQANTALRHYRKLDALLQKELDVHPEPETRAIFADARKKALPAKEEPPPQAAPISGREMSRREVRVYQFRDLSPEANNQYFAEGLCENITTALSQIRDLQVVVLPMSAFSEPDGSHDPSQAADDEEVFALVGAISKVSDRVRVTARLVGERSGRVYWSENYDRNVQDIFAVQDDITLKITVEMRIKLSEGEKIRVLAKFTDSYEVWDKLMRADVLINTLIEEDNLEARRLLRAALEIDPDCAAAWGELADSYIGDYMMGRRRLPKSDILEQAINAAQNALDIQPEFTHALNVISLAQAFGGAFDNAARTAREALSADPRNPEIAANSAYALVLSGHPAEAEAIMRHAIDSTPIPPMWYVAVLGLCEYLQGRHAAAVQTLTQAVDLVPNSAFARPYLLGALMETGEHAAAQAQAAEIKRVHPEFDMSTWPGADFADELQSNKLIQSLKTAGLT